MQTTTPQISIFEWISKIIQTSNNDFHFDAVDKLIDLFHEREKDEQKCIELKLLRKAKWDEIHGILS
jgi:hypothetical protein